MIRLTDFSPCKFYVEKEEEIAKRTLKKFKGEFRLYERSFDMLMETFDCIVKSTKIRVFDSIGKTASIIILPKVIQSLQSFRLLNIRGQYYDSAIIARSLLESIGLCAHLSSDEEEANLWMSGKPIKLASIHLIDLARWLGNRKDDAKMKMAYRAIYGQLCDYVHTNVRSAISLTTTARTKKQRTSEVPRPNLNLQIAPRFDKKEVEFIAAYPLLATLILQDIFKAELKPYKKMQEKMDALLDLYFRTRKGFISSLSTRGHTRKPPKSTSHQ